jgi:hypothetical protein
MATRHPGYFVYMCALRRYYGDTSSRIFLVDVCVEALLWRHVVSDTPRRCVCRGVTMATRVAARGPVVPVRAQVYV